MKNFSFTILSLISMHFTYAQSKPATEITRQANEKVLQTLPFSNKDDYADASKGFIATIPNMQIKKDTDGSVIWALDQYDFLKQDKAPNTVNPSLWRIAQINMNNGLFKVTDGIYQIRGFDLSNMTIIEGKEGLIIIDPLISSETARAGLELYYKNRPKKPVSTVIYTHSHIDHYGGVNGVVKEADVKSGKVKIYAPEGFLEEAISENVYAGNAMSRRSLYMYGARLPKSAEGQVDGGLGKTTSLGVTGLIPPTEIIKKTGEKHTIDGIETIFYMAPGTEAPAEMLMFFPKLKTLCAAEDATHTVHNLYTLRGAQVRDAKAWWKTLNGVIDTWGDDIEVVFAQHHWPTWGNAKVIEFLSKQRDMMKFTHDHTLNLMNKGYTMLEVGEMVKLPQSLGQEWYNRDYYGSMNHNAKAVYNRYLGFYSSNPADLYQLTPEDASKKYVDFMGGAASIITKAKESYKKGEYRWVAQVMNHVVFADQNNTEAKELEADALEQLGYQTEDPTWRNEFLMGAFELRKGVPKVSFATSASPETISAMSIDMIFDFMGITLNVDKAKDKKMLINYVFTDTNQKYAVSLQNSVFIYSENKQHAKPDITLTLLRSTLNEITGNTITMEDAIKKGNIKVSGDTQKLTELGGLFDKFQMMFPIVTP